MEVEPGTQLFNEGQEEDAFYVVMQGQVAVVVPPADVADDAATGGAASGCNRSGRVGGEGGGGRVGGGGRGGGGGGGTLEASTIGLAAVTTARTKDGGMTLTLAQPAFNNADEATDDGHHRQDFLAAAQIVSRTRSVVTALQDGSGISLDDACQLSTTQPTGGGVGGVKASQDGISQRSDSSKRTAPASTDGPDSISGRALFNLAPRGGRGAAGQHRLTSTDLWKRGAAAAVTPWGRAMTMFRNTLMEESAREERRRRGCMSREGGEVGGAISPASPRVHTGAAHGASSGIEPGSGSPSPRTLYTPRAPRPSTPRRSGGAPAGTRTSMTSTEVGFLL